MYGSNAHPTFTNCEFIDNYASNGGAVEVYYGNATFEHCSFVGNYLTSGSGAAIYSYYGYELNLTCCTFAMNQASADPTVYLYQSDTVISTSIFAQNTCTAPVSVSGGTLDVSYTDICDNSGGDWVGALSAFEGINGNICEDPLFEDANNYNMRLTGPSPCIDTGDPNLPYDPDNTIADMGAYYFDHEPLPGNIWLSSPYDPWYLFSNGGTVQFTARIRNNLEMPVTFQGWVMITLPSGQLYGPTMQANVSMQAASEMTTNTLSQVVPSYAPMGVYTLIAHIGLFPSTIHSDEIQFVKMGMAADGSEAPVAWEKLAYGWTADAPAATPDIPDEFELGTAYPNPFNATTTISLKLPVSQQVTVTLFDVTGRQVKTVRDGVLSAGNHRIDVDAHGLATGVYLLRAQTDRNGSQVQKLVLVK
ncbi:T9SS type A sorting domain-containing protein [bacterium]|nr:T9SS type A sorting domain-containing protein [bacterium]